MQRLFACWDALQTHSYKYMQLLFHVWMPHKYTHKHICKHTRTCNLQYHSSSYLYNVPAEISSGGSHVNNRLPFLTRLKLAFLGGLRAVDEILTCSKKQKKCVAQMAAPQQQKHRRQWYMHRNIKPPSNHPTQQQFTLFLSRSSNATSFRFPALSTPRNTAHS